MARPAICRSLLTPMVFQMLMIDDIKFRWKLHWVRRRQDRIAAQNVPDRTQPRADNDNQASRDYYWWQPTQARGVNDSGPSIVEELAEQELRHLQHEYIAKQARALLIPLPRYSRDSDDWEVLDQLGSVTLTSEALASLGREVRQERRERLELLFLWPSAFLGAIGGIAGICAVFH